MVEPVAVVRAFHVIFASLWAGGGFFGAFVLGPHLAAAGPVAGQFMRVVVRRGGFTWFFATTGILTLLTGGYVYGELGYASDPFGDASRSLVTVGAILGVLAVVHGAAAIAPLQRRLKKLALSMPEGPPTPAQAAEFQRLGMRQGRATAASTMMILVALLAMTLRVLFV